MFKVKSNGIMYSSYFLLVVLSYIMSLNIIPSYLQYIFSIFLYLIALSSILFILNNGAYTIRKDVLIVLTTVLLLCIFKAISVVLNFDFLTSIKYILANSIFYFFIFLLVYKISYTYSLRDLLAPFILMSIIVTIISLAILFGYKPTFYFTDEEALQSYLLISESKQGLIGFSGPYLNQNQFAIVMFISFALFLSIFLGVIDSQKPSELYKKYFIIIFLLLSMFLTITTLSRASILAIFVVIIIVGLKGYKNKKSVLFLSFLFVFIFSMLIYFNDTISRLIERFSDDGTSSRIDIWVEALTVFQENYLFGVGSYSYSEGGVSFSAHNVYLQQLVSNGVLAFILWFGLILYFIKVAFLNILTKNFDEKNNQKIFLSALYIAILIHQLFETTIINVFHPMTLLMFAIMFTLIKKCKVQR